jgi:glycosyltransferase involved in cell wall biosynthesis
MTRLNVLLTPRALGGHEKALFGWLADAARTGALEPRVILPGAARALASSHGKEHNGLVPAAFAAGLLPQHLGPGASHRAGVVAALAALPRSTPLLLAPGVLHAQAWLLAAAVALGHRPWVYVPMTYTAAQMGYRAADWRDRLLAPWLQAVQGWVTIDAFQAQQLRTAWGVHRPIHVLPNVVRLPVAVASLAPPLPDAHGDLRVAYVGRFDPVMKGLDWLSALLRQRPAALRSVRWCFQGEGPGGPLLQALAQDLGPERVQVRPFAPLDPALAACDVLVMPSRYEGFPLVALEATARGWPVVATHGARLGELLPAQSQFEFGDAAGLARALELLRSAAARQEAVVYAQQRLAQLLPPERYAAALRSVVGAMVGAPS